MALNASRSYLAGSGQTLCRKRPHSQMSRSESRSESPWNPPRTLLRTSITPSSTSESAPQSATQDLIPPSFQYPGDSLDFRTPTMPSTSAATASNAPVIDLTSDADDRLTRSSATSRHSTHLPQRRSRSRRPRSNSVRSRVSRTTGTVRPPRFGRDIIAGDAELIDLSSMDDEVERSVSRSSRRRPSVPPRLLPDSSTSSSDIEFMGSREVPQPSTTSHPEPVAEPIRPLFQPFTTGFNALRDMIVNPSSQRGVHLTGLSGNSTAAQAAADQLERESIFFQTVRNITAAAASHRPYRPRPQTPMPNQSLIIEDFDDVQLDYTQQAFAVGGIINGVGHDSTPDRRAPPPYKAPPAAKEGFTRKIEEEDMVICAACGDELCTGDEDVKRQVWIARHCGHGYCGECATNRTLKKGGNQRQKRVDTQHRSTAPFKTCLVAGCSVPVSHKTAMVQVYLSA